MAKVTTLPAILQPLMGKPSIRLPYCAVCGRFQPLNQHHIVRRGAGRMFNDAGLEIEKPTITLCGFGNHLKAQDGSEYCHGLAHANRLHFRWIQADKPYANAGHWEYLKTDEPVSYMDALEMRGWRAL
jgi:hypothetical protein